MKETKIEAHELVSHSKTIFINNMRKVDSIIERL